VLADSAHAADLVFCLGASELVATGLCAIDPLAWPDFFASARTSTAGALIETLRFDLHAAADRQEAARALATLKHRALLQIAIGDLLGRFSVVDTMRAMSRHADNCIGARLAAATRILA
jgi:glutamine synthetase adenylyltransferase